MAQNSRSRERTPGVERGHDDTATTSTGPAETRGQRTHDVATAAQRSYGNRIVARTPQVQALAPGGLARAPTDLRHDAAAGVRGKGGPLPHLGTLERLLGHDLRGVEAFTDAAARDACRTIGAEAYATGDKVAFSRRDPDLRTTAHEAVHVLQQRAGLELQGGVGHVGDPHERHADAVADRVARGESAERSLDTYFSGRPAGPAAARGGSVTVQRSLGGDLEGDLDTSKNEETQTEERYATIIAKLADAIEDRNAKGESLSINPDAVLAPMLYRLEKRDGDVIYSTYRHLIEALKARGAILIDGKESGAADARPTDKFVINLVLPGSGDRRWRTFAENMLGDGVATRKAMFARMKEISGIDKTTRRRLGVESGKKVYPTLFEDAGTASTGVTYMIRGPGTTDSTSTHPSNSIAGNVKTAKAIVESYLKDWKDESVKVRIMGHSRNGVAAAILSRDLKGEHSKLEVESVIFDPVPGGDASALHGYDEVTLPDDEKAGKGVDSTVIFSLMDDRVGFNPLSVYGAKRLILTQYSHHAGIEPGFVYKGRHHKGLGLLDLPPGLFIDERQSPGKPNFLKGPITDWEYIEIVLTVAKMEKDDKNKNRIERIRGVVEAFLKSKREEVDAADFPVDWSAFDVESA